MTTAERGAWRLRRALAMTPREIGLRAYRAGRRRLRRPAAPRPQESLAVASDVVKGARGEGEAERRVLEALARSRATLLPGASDRSALRAGLEAIGVDPGGVVEAAEAVLAGRIPALGRGDFHIGADPDWHSDPVTGERWALEFWADVNLYGGSRPAEPRLCWEVNRHHQLVTLARAHAVSGEARFAAAVWRQIEGWISANPPLFGINWASPLEIAIRLISWCMALDLIGAEGAGKGAAGRMAVSAALQARHVHDNLTVYASSRNNHLIGEAAGLVLAGAKLPFLAGSERWARVGVALIEREVPAQTAPDGGSREQTCHYGAFVLELSLAARAALEVLGQSPDPRLDESMARVADFLSSLAGPGGVPPSIGDDDGGRALALSDGGLDRQPIRAAVTARAVLGAATGASASASDLEPAVWLLRADRVPRGLYAPTGGDERGGPRAFEESGYYVQGGGEQHGVIDCGPLGYLSTAAHGHADCLSFNAWHGGRWVLVDPGTYCYQADRSLRDHFRSTRAHNTVRVDGRDQSEMLGPFLWGRRADATALAWSAGPGWQYFEGEHDGYARSGVVHRRSLVYVAGGYWIVADLLLGAGRHEASATFQLAEGMSADRRGELTFADADGRGVQIVPWLPDGFEVEVVRGREAEPAGWVSPGFGLMAPAPALVATGAAALPTALAFAVLPLGAGGPSAVSCPSGPRAEGIEVVATVEGGRDRLLFGSTGGGGERFAGRFGFVRERHGETEASGLDVSEWTRGGAGVDFLRAENQLRGRERSGARR